MPDSNESTQSASDFLGNHSKGIKKLLPFLGPAFIAAVAYVDPGNYATNITAGSKYGYTLLWVIVASNLMAGLIQSLSAKLGIATGKNLPELCRERFSEKISLMLWLQAEVVIIATDLAEFIGAALGIYLLFGLPLITSAIIAAVVSFAILEIQRRGYRKFEALIIGMLCVVVIAFGAQVFYAKPDTSALLIGFFTPKFEGINSILLSAGMLGATVMPHAIYLHSALTQVRIVGKNDVERKQIFKFEQIDIIIAMCIAGGINAAMLIVSAALFHKNSLLVEDLDVAFHQFGVILGPNIAILFGIGLLFAGLSSSSVGTMTGEIVMQGFIKRHIPVYLRRVITMLPPLVIILTGINPSKALVMSQVVLSFGIAFALVPLIMFTGNKKIMGNLVSHRFTSACAWLTAVLIIGLNLFLLFNVFSS